MVRHYSRLATLEEKRNTKRAIRFLFLTVIAIILLYFFGLPLVVKFAAFLTDIRKSATPVEITDITPPAPPQIATLPEATNKRFLELTGKSEAGATLFIVLNDKTTELVADEEGKFTTKLTLSDGENTVYAYARDKAGNVGQKTSLTTVIFDNIDPKLEITSPADGTQFAGTKNQKVKIEGTTEADVNLTINERFVAVRDDGSFFTEVTLSEGDNLFTAKVADKAGNEAEKVFTLKYAP